MLEAVELDEATPAVPLVVDPVLEDVSAVVEVDDPAVLDVVVVVVPVVLEVLEVVVDVLLPLEVLVVVDDPHTDPQSTPKGQDSPTLT